MTIAAFVYLSVCWSIGCLLVTLSTYQLVLEDKEGRYSFLVVWVSAVLVWLASPVLLPFCVVELFWGVLFYGLEGVANFLDRLWPPSKPWHQLKLRPLNFRNMAAELHAEWASPDPGPGRVRRRARSVLRREQP